MRLETGQILPNSETVPEWDLEKTIPQRFAAIVERFPDRIAIVDQGISLTYREFNEQANRIAEEILDKIGGDNKRVGLVLNNGVHFYLAAMAALKANKCYVPLDPVQPVDRLGDYLKITEPECFVTDARYEAVAREINKNSCPIISSDICTDAGSIENPIVSCTPQSECFVILTSGSTGAPKGVIHGHQGSLHNVRTFAREFALTPDDRFMTLYTPAVFGAQRDLLLGLMTGVTTYHYPVRELGFAGIGSFIAANKITGFGSVVTIFRRFLEALSGEDDLSSLRFVTAGGESAYWEDMRRAFEHLPSQCQVYTGLAMSEGNIVTTQWIGSDFVEKGEKVPIGVPAEDKTVELRQEDGTAAGPGEVGEIFVTSKYIALGYLNAPEEVAQRFRTHENGNGIRTIATGDLAQTDEDGRLIIVGRADHQVKLRGYRVDLSEVETQISKHTDVAECVVKVHHSEDHEDLLVAYVRMTSQGKFSVTGLRDFVGRRLSTYMMPSHFVLMQHIPQTHSGKVDRRALTMPEEVSREGLGPYVEARNDLDEWLIDIWEGWISVKGIGIDDDFFDVGGDSLSATQLLMQIDEVYEAELDAEAILNSCNTIRKMSDHLAALSDKASLNAEDRDPLDINFVDANENFENSNRPELYRLDKESGLRIGKPHATLGNISLNNLGFRGPDVKENKPQGHLRIAFMGSSIVFDPAVSCNEMTWPHKVTENLQQHFPDQDFDYVNAGLPGYTTVRSQRLFENFIAPLEPDIVIIQVGDLNRDANYLARQQGIFDGVAYRRSALARKSRLALLLEKNATVGFRILNSLFPWRKLDFNDDIASEFEERLKHLIATCKEKGRLVLLVECRRLNSGQSLLQKLRSLTSYCLYMPYMSLNGFLRAQKLYREAGIRATQSEGCLFFEATDALSSDSTHFADSSHFRDAGSRRMAELIADYLARDPGMAKLLTSKSPS